MGVTELCKLGKFSFFKLYDAEWYMELEMKRCWNNSDGARFRKVAVNPETDHENPEWKNSYSSTLSLTSVLNGNKWLTPRSGRFSRRERTGTHCTGGREGSRSKSGL
jgi:hypothetical protein